MTRDDLAALNDAIEIYLDAHYTGETQALFDQVWHPQAHLYSTSLSDDGRLVDWDRDAFADALKNRTQPADKGSPRDERLVFLDAGAPGMVAAKLELRVGDMKFVDYLVFLRLAPGWRIISKACAKVGG